MDRCPEDGGKSAPGICGCGVPDEDGDGDGTIDCEESCPDDPDKETGGQCGCGVADTDSDGDGTADCNDGCPDDADKVAEGVCGCGIADDDADADGTPDCNDACPDDVDKTAPGVCGCGTSDADADGDGFPVCEDACPADPNKQNAGLCGCGVSDEGGACTDVPATDHCAPVRDWDPEWRQFEQEVLTLVNEYRASGANCDSEGNYGPTDPLAMNAELRCAARLHSLDMGVRDYFDHTSPEGVGPGTRIADAGYDAWTWGENIAWGQTSPQQVVDGWIDSDGHCANIMNPGFEDIGVGYYYEPGENPWDADRLWTQVFGRQ